MIEFRDKGAIPLAHPDSKTRPAYDAKTGFVAVVSIDLKAKRFSLWWQPDGWVVENEPYGNVDLTDWALVVHDGAAKLVAATWEQTSPDGRAHLVFATLKQLY